MAKTKKIFYNVALVGAILLANPDLNAEGEGFSYIDDGVYYSDIVLPIGFEKEQVKALESGIVFNLELNFRIVNIRNWRPDNNIGELNQVYTIEFNAFTRRYKNTGRQASMATSTEVTGYLSTIKRLPLVHDSLLVLDVNYTVILDTSIKAQGVSQWVRTISFWREGLDSDLEQIQWQLIK